MESSNTQEPLLNNFKDIQEDVIEFYSWVLIVRSMKIDMKY